MKVFISIDIEGINSICAWDETEVGDRRYAEFQAQLVKEVSAACEAAKAAGATEIFVKDAHSSARNLLVNDLPEYITLHRGWEGSIASMMGGLDSSFDAVMFVGYHSPSRSMGNPLSHTMNTSIHHVKINGVIASEFLINALYASYNNVPVAFLAGDDNLTNQVKAVNNNIETVATKKGVGGAVISKHPQATVKEIREVAEKALRKNLSGNIVEMPKHFNIEVQYKRHQDAYSKSFYPGCKLIDSDTIAFEADDYRDVLVAFKFVL